MQKLTALKPSLKRAVPENKGKGKGTGKGKSSVVKGRSLANVAACVVVLGLFGTACSDGAGDDKAKDSLAGDSGKTDEDKAVEYRKCLRDNGLKVPEPDPKKGGMQKGLTITESEKGKAEKAFKACKDKAPNGGRPQEVSQADKDNALKFAKCMRDNGVNMPDPQFNKGGASRAMPMPKTDADKKKFEKALKACEGLNR
ncbi:hypothetical protein ACPYPG_29100 [Streptomyces sp. FR-108]|uniref:hypothetical protein n=1 Tax=Streptomyces sp. FR-108 TaxID=3416665 RepID=UPI003CEF4EBC